MTLGLGKRADSLRVGAVAPTVAPLWRHRVCHTACSGSLDTGIDSITIS